MDIYQSSFISRTPVQSSPTLQKDLGMPYGSLFGLFTILKAVPLCPIRTIINRQFNNLHWLFRTETSQLQKYSIALQL